jgi:phosphoribosylformylglycinamidine (FGAM) synthase PurS component
MNVHVAEMKKKKVRDPAGNVVTGAKELLSTCKRQHIVLL